MYAISRFSRENEDRIYQIYVTDCLKIIAENTKLMSGGVSPNKRFFDIIDKTPEDTRTGEEIIERISNKLTKLKGGGKNEC